MKQILRILAVLIIIFSLMLITGCEEDEEFADGAITIGITGIPVGDFAMIVAAVYPFEAEPSDSFPLGGFKQECSAGGTFSFTLKEMDGLDIGTETWEGEGNEHYDLYVYLTIDDDDDFEDAGDLVYNHFPIYIEPMDGDVEIMMLFTDFVAP